jgi:hypothetical protein
LPGKGGTDISVGQVDAAPFLGSKKSINHSHPQACIENVRLALKEHKETPVSCRLFP